MATSRRKRPSNCRQCKKPATRNRVISFRGLCIDCAIENVANQNRAMALGTGPEYERYEAERTAGLRRYAEKLGIL